MSTTDTRDIAPPITDIPASPAGDLATQRDALPMKTLTLIGVAGRPDHRLALLRDRDGTILNVRYGDRTPGGTVQAIGESEIILARAGKAVRLKMPD